MVGTFIAASSSGCLCLVAPPWLTKILLLLPSSLETGDGVFSFVGSICVCVCVRKKRKINICIYD